MAGVSVTITAAKVLLSVLWGQVQATWQLYLESRDQQTFILVQMLTNRIMELQAAIQRAEGTAKVKLGAEVAKLLEE